MNTTAICRLTWKEYRVQRQLWLAILILAPATQLLAKVITALSGEQHHPETYVVMAIVAVGVYLLGCGATLFATEHETGTFDFQRTLPVNARQVLVAKVGLAVVSAAALLWALVALTHLFFQAPVSAISWLSWQAGIVTLVEVLAWSIFFSLLLKQPLSAAVCAIFPPSLTTCVIFPIAFEVVWHTYGDLMAYYRFSLPPRAAIAGLVLLFDIWLAHRWFHGTIGWPSWLSIRRRTERSVLPQPRSSLPTFTGQRQTGWDYLVWLTWRQGRWLILAAGGLCGWMLLAFATRTIHGLNDVLFVFPLVLGPILFGLAAFSFDQSAQQFRFFAERGVSSRWLWFVRHGVWIPLVFVMGSLVMLVESSASRNTPLDSFYSAGGWLVLTLTFYAVSQTCAMLFRSTLVAFVVAIFGAVLAQGWLMLVIFAGIPVWWAILPIPVVLLFATWLLAPDWIEERRGRRYWLKLTAVLGAPALAVLIGCALFRAYEIPLVDPGFDVDEYTRPLTAVEKRVLENYGEVVRKHDRDVAALTALNLSRDELQQRRVASFRQVLPRLDRLHLGIAAPLALLNAGGENLGEFFPTQLLDSLRLSAKALEAEGKLDDAWQHYEIALELLHRARLRSTVLNLHGASKYEPQLLEQIVAWSAHPQQSFQRVSTAIRKLKSEELHEEANVRVLKTKYVTVRSVIQSGRVDQSWFDSETGTRLHWVYRLMPWERERALRLIRFNIALTFDWKVIELRNDGDGGPSWFENTIWPTVELVDGDTHLKASRGAARIRIALLDWQREHGQLPDSLDALVGLYFPEIPSGPDNPFFYSRTGLAEHIETRSGDRSMHVVLKVNEAFLWAPLHRSGATENSERRPEFFLYDSPATPSRALEADRVWPITPAGL